MFGNTRIAIDELGFHTTLHPTMIQHFSILFTGFSVFAIAILLLAYLFYLPDMRKSTSGKAACALLLGSLALLQLAHYHYFSEGSDLLGLRHYGLLLMCIPPLFFFFARVALFTDVTYSRVDAFHLLPFILGIVISIRWLPPVAFLFGTAYTFWFARLVFKLRGQHGRFKFEMFFFGLFALMAVIALGLGLTLPYLDHHIYYSLYANSISTAIFLIIAALIFFPQLLGDILEITELAYAKSKLNGIDTKSKIEDLENLMSIEKHFQNEQLSLTNVADILQLSPHQLSELINTHYGFGFPRFVREHRVHEAKRLLICEPDASVLSISMMIGFKTQSNFYTAFKEITGDSPGQYRKKFASN